MAVKGDKDKPLEGSESVNENNEGVQTDPDVPTNNGGMHNQAILMPAGSAGSAGSAGIEQVQELLFGVQVRQLNDKIFDIEQKSQETLAGLRRDMNENISLLAFKLEQINAQLNEKITVEVQARVHGIAELGNSLSETRQHIENLHTKNEKTHREMEQRFMTQAERISEDLNVRTEDMLQKLEMLKAKLGDEKTDRSMLVTLLRQMAEHIDRPNSDF